MEQDTNTSGATGLMEKVRDSATTQLGAQKDRATEGIGSVAQAVRQSTQHLRDQQHETIAQYVEQAADQLERFANRMKDRNVSELLAETQDLARRRPALFIGAAFAAGLLGARFIKSSADRSRGIGAARGNYAGGRSQRTGEYDSWNAGSSSLAPEPGRS